MSNTTDGRTILDAWLDLQCPDCHAAQQDLSALRTQFGDALEVRLRHFPLPHHQYASSAAQAAEEAYAQGHGDAYTASLLTRTDRLGSEGTAVLTELATELGLDAEEVDTALIDGRHALIVDADQAEGAALGITGTPTYVVGDHRLDGGKSQEGLRERIAAIVIRLLESGERPA